ncbi:MULTISPECIES: poly-beta-1,6 N-acetyl-D-glucosamine export porin PgaA [unclassified Neisseria]|uniref:poly-beta-1,6 N-acetyl-D-glucosamine export porin PgaA n=1 Tax=unclassified Neisseria TaxID=2623750 RepID=UPI0026655299|nr:MULTISPECIES: poly-beta-1,6 N-acetyl-D-glucosamine export porin PgaA [unclassified Neisseria]MDO1510952.1 poly-beta-1,6 N-acetyl-D-glucosamine export porin PgaA [Neisseria sp. MVDL19-042950]MDO1517208.1 poly-beta-1,6 N-acetyl-D-glucosamine export porin PgaA [Neisseria sp. MVDL18-041461]MDO1564571.1 poly-beta-1,6 N-acetyl-D-glucosamine export porin PgaA [Neisseria sp. MVDL20-010259]
MKKIPLYIAVALAAIPLTAAAKDIQAERERWVIHARSGDAQLAEAVNALKKLYAENRDPKVRADLIALLVRQQKFPEALAVCTTCGLEDFSNDELENLAKAARDSKQFPLSVSLYKRLQTKAPGKKIGYLGGALAAVDAADYSGSQKQINEYRRRFGNDKDIQDAEKYLKLRTQSITERMADLQKQLEANPNDHEAVIQLYRLAARLQAFPQQERLLKRYPKLFSEQDRLWLKETQAVVLLRSARPTTSSDQLHAAYRRLSEIVDKAPAGSALHTQALRDRMAAAIAVGKEKQAIKDYHALVKKGDQPDYVKEQYAFALLMYGSPREAKNILADRAAKQKAKQGKVDPEIIEGLIEADADLLHFSEAKKHLKGLNPDKYARDFTHTVYVRNPYYDKHHFWRVRLEAWSGNMKGAIKLMDEWLAEHPGDPWAMVLRGELAQWNGHEDEAIRWFDKSREFLSEENQKWANNKAGIVLLNSGDWSSIQDLVSEIDRNDLNYHDFWKFYDKERAAQLNISGNVLKATSPKDKVEWHQEIKLYSPRSQGEHRAYVVQRFDTDPNNGNVLRAGRVGAGAEVSLYPVTLNAEAGRGTHLNNKAYLNAGVDYRVNDYLSLTARAALNSANTPIKALSQNVYANEYTVNAELTPSNVTRAGLNLGVMKFDDGNTRRTAQTWLTRTLFQHNRWKVGSSLSVDYSRNKEIAGRYYYNPKADKSINGSLDLSYTMPFVHAAILDQKITGGIGRYWQEGENSENTWMLKYGHDWQFGKQAKLGYELGRQQAIYDGKPEYQNFGNVNLNVKFH